MSNNSSSLDKKSAELHPALAVGANPSLKEPCLIGDFVLWLEQRPAEGGRTTALIRPWFRRNSIPQELTPAPSDLRTRVHGYGGAPLVAALKEDKILIAWIDDTNGQLWTQSWLVKNNSTVNKSNFLEPFSEPICLSKQGDYCFAGGVLDLTRNCWIGVMESNSKDYVVKFFLDEASQEPLIIYSPKDFIGYLALNVKTNMLAWIEWQAPYMPWDCSELWVAELDHLGLISRAVLIGGNTSEDSPLISVFQPIWLSNNELVVSEDSTGWWNVMFAEIDLNLGPSQLWERSWPMEAEIASPQWVLGMSNITCNNKDIIVSMCQQGSWQLAILNKDGSVKKINQPFNNFSGLYADNERLVAIASSPFFADGLFELDLNSGKFNHSKNDNLVFIKEEISIPEPINFKGYSNETTHAWYYPPIDSENYPAPLLVKSHSGPTSMARSGLNLEIQFWTSRGWGVVDVNYGGSTGFGRSYRERLKSNWGKVDVFDCAAAAKALIKVGKANKKLIAIEGGSAGGFTTLGCLCFTNIFSVGACKYAVSDLLSMAQSTHRFEEHYLEYLIGSLSKNKRIYNDRSPLYNVNNISSPIILFQGLKDKVVLPEQTEKIANALKSNNIPVEVHTFDNEGHGFKDGQVKISVLELTEKFFRKYLSI